MGQDPSYGAVLTKSMVGPLTVWVENDAIVRLDWGAYDCTDHPLAREAVDQLAAYFAGTREAFDLPIAPAMSDFQTRFGKALMDIPFGETLTYGELSKIMGVPAQAIGQACGANPIPVIVPCHRVLAQCGLGGYSGAGGIEAKVTLLRLESAASLLI